MAFPQGIDFRSTSGYVTDPADHTHETSVSGGYPRTTPQGNTVGWEATVNGVRDRSSSVDARLAGVAFRTSGSANYRLDLPATGDYDIRLAVGDATNINNVYTELFDTAASLGVLASGTTAAGNFKDATNTNYTAANWPSSNTAVTKTFATTICRFSLNQSAGGGVVVIAHLHVAAAGGGTPAGLSTEADASLPLPAVQIKDLGRADETDAAIALSAVQVAAAGVAVEVDSAFALAAVQLQPVGLATETDTALALAAGSANAAGLAEEADSAIALSGVQITATGIALETDAALALTGIAGTAPGVATEADAAFALAAVQKMATGLAAETDEALAPGAAAADVGISLGGRRRKRDWRSFDVMPHWTPPDADGDMSDGEPVPPEEDAEPVKVRSALSMGLDGSGDAPAPVEPAAAVVEVAPEPEAKPLTLADVITRDDLTHDELVQAIKLLARAQSGGLVRSTPRLTLRRVS